MAVFDIAVVYLALPSIERSIGAGLVDDLWIASAYGLMEAGFTLAAGTLGDLYGCKRVYVIGVFVFIFGSIGSGLAPMPGFLIASRFVQGVGGAIAMALPLAILMSMNEDQVGRERSIRTYATIAGLGAVTAPAIGGLLVQALTWRSVFFVNVPVSIFVLYAALAHTPETKADTERKLDVGGQLTSALALIAFTFAVIEGNALGWLSPTIGVAVLICVASAAAFVAIERRSASPMIRFAVLKDRLLSVGAWNMLLMNVGFFTLYLIASLFIQDVRRIDAVTAGWYLLANNFLFFSSNQFSGVIVHRLGERATAIVGIALGAVGIALFAGFHADTPAPFILAPLALCGLGWGIAFTPLNDLAMSAVPARDDGLASALLSIGRPLGAVFGTAIFGSVLGAFMERSLQAKLTAVNAPAQTVATIAETIRHGGMWSLMHHAQKLGLPAHALRESVEAGFMTGMRWSGVIAALVMAVGVLYAVVVYRSRETASAE